MIDFPSNPTNGQVYGNWIYDSSITAWRNVNTDTGIGTLNAMGLKNVVPTSVVVGSGSATVNSNGLVTFTAANSISLNGIFTSTYANYKIDININSTTGSPGGFQFRYLASGVDRSSSNYFLAGFYSTASSATGGYSASSLSGADMGYIYVTGDSYTSGTLEIKTPANPSLMTKSICTLTGLSSGGVNQTTWTNNLHNVNQAHDGIRFFGSAGTTMNGTINVYGYTN